MPSDLAPIIDFYLPNIPYQHGPTLILPICFVVECYRSVTYSMQVHSVPLKTLQRIFINQCCDFLVVVRHRPLVFFIYNCGFRDDTLTYISSSLLVLFYYYYYYYYYYLPSVLKIPRAKSLF